MRYLRGIMGVGRLAIAAGVIGLVSSGLFGCGERTPPPLGDYDGGEGGTLLDVYVAPCSSPTPGCPCPDAGIQEVCGTIYHYAGSYVTCSKEYITCQDDGTWSACVGPTVFGAE